MKKFVFILLVSIYSISIYAQDPQSVFPKHAMMLGGDKKIATTKTLTMDIEIESPAGKLTGKVKILNNFGYKLEVSGKDGKKSYEIVSNAGYYKMDAKTNSKEINQISSSEFKIRKFLMKVFALGEYNNPEFKSSLEYLPNEMINGIPCYAYKSRIEGAETNLVYYIDEVTLQIVKITANYMNQAGEQKEMSYEYGNFQKAKDGSFYPGYIATPYGKAIVKSYKLDETVSPTEFQPEFIK